jgi:hypothetical protein
VPLFLAAVSVPQAARRRRLNPIRCFMKTPLRGRQPR